MLLALLPVLLVSTVLGAFFITERFRDLDDLLDQRALAMAKQLAPVCEYGVMTGNNAILQNIANNMLEEPDVRSVTIMNQDRQALAHSGPRMLNARNADGTLERGQLRLMRAEGSVRVLSPILAQNLVIPDQLSNEFYVEETPAPKILGWAELELSASNTYLKRYQYVSSALGIILVVLLISGYIAYRISRYMVGPIRGIMRALKDLIAGKYETRIHLTGTGELNAIAQTVNTLAAELQRLQTDYQRNIETATRDLQENMDELEVRCSQLSLGKREAQDAIRMKSEFLTNISHEIRTPLSGLRGYIDLLQRTSLNDRQRDCLETMSAAADDLMRMINDLLDLSKLEADKAIFEHNPFNLYDILDDVTSMLTPVAINQRIDLACNIASNVPVNLIGDGLRLKQVLTNLIGNGIKFTRIGGVTVQATQISRNNNQTSIQFAITDTGIGMSETARQRLFQPFAQADASTSREYGGTGLGLIIARALVQHMHGDITVTSTPGTGSCFTFHVTLEVNSEPQEHLTPIPGKRLAVLTSESVSRDHIHNLLAQWQMDCIDCRTIEALYELLDDPASSVDGVILAVDRECLGSTLCQNLSQRLQPHQLPLFTLINSLQHDDMDRLREYGASSVLSRPVNHRRLHQELLKQFIPKDLRQPTNAEITPLTSQSGQHPPTVLTVDDNNANLRLITTLLQDLDVPVLSASSGEEAIRLVREQRVDLVFMDIQMPGMNGLETTRHIRSLPALRHVPVIALTAHAMADERRTLINEGMNDYQTKPISLQQLADCIQRWTGYVATIPTYSKTISGPAVASPVQDDAETAGGIFSASLALKSASGKPAIAADMFSMLLESLPMEIATIREAWENDDLEGVGRAVHKLNGACRYCGVPALRNSLEQAETDLRKRDYQQLPDRLRQLNNDAENLLRWAAENDWLSMINSGK